MGCRRQMIGCAACQNAERTVERLGNGRASCRYWDFGPILELPFLGVECSIEPDEAIPSRRTLNEAGAQAISVSARRQR